jgi:aspartate aminotransferase-like enzyme
MQTYPIPMVPGPVRVPAEVLQAYQLDYGSGDLEAEFLALYNQTEAGLRQIMATHNKVAIFTGEGMLALWAGLKSCLKPGERVLCLATGVFGYGMGDMARQLGAEVRTVGLNYDETLHDWEALDREIAAFRPKMITMVHCETPSGTLNPVAEVGRLKHKHGVPLLSVDAVASLAGAPVLVDEWGIDLLLGGSQKALSVPPAMSFVAVSPAAWEIVQAVGYPGYDALLPFLTAQDDFYFPFTPYWHGMAALNVGVQRVLAEGLPAVFARHERVAAFCREQLQACGYQLFPAPGAVNAPTVTAVKVPEELGWRALDQRARQQGLVMGGSYGPLAGKVFRLGHMGSQADQGLVAQAIAVLKAIRG